MIGSNRQIGKFPLSAFFAISNIKLSVYFLIIVCIASVIDIILILGGSHDQGYFVIIRLTVQCCIKITGIKTSEFYRKQNFVTFCGNEERKTDTKQDTY